jgi:small conductance mechanosensitive channel
VAELGDSAAALTLRYWTSVSDFHSAKTDLNKSVRVTLNVGT